jgi:hypothetical protein
MVTYYSFIKLPVGGHGTGDLTSNKVNLRIAFAVLYTCRASSSTSMSSVRRSDTSKSLDLFCFMNCNAASMICSLGTSSQKIYCYHLTAKMKVCFLIVFLTFFFSNTRTSISEAKILKYLSNTKKICIVDSSLPYIFSMFSVTL